MDKQLLSDLRLSYNNLNTIKDNKIKYTRIKKDIRNKKPVNDENKNTVNDENKNTVNDENKNIVNDENKNPVNIKYYNNNIDEVALKIEQNDGGKTWGVLKENSSGQANSVCFGGGRYVNQVIRAYGFSLFAEKFDLYMDYKGKDYIEKLGFKLYCGKNKYQNSEGLNDTDPPLP